MTFSAVGEDSYIKQDNDGKHDGAQNRKPNGLRILRWVTYPTKEWVNGYSSEQPEERKQTYQLQQRALPPSSHVVGDLANEFESLESACRHKK
jgi:hypothetical protein